MAANKPANPGKGGATAELLHPITHSLAKSSAIFVGVVVGFLNLCAPYASSPPPGRRDIIIDLEGNNIPSDPGAIS